MASHEKPMFAFIMICFSSMFWPALPPMSMLPILCVLTALCLYYCRRNWITGLVIGFLWASSVGHWYSSWQLPYRFFNKNIMIEGVVDSLHIEQKQGKQINYLKDTYVYPTSLTKKEKEHAVTPTNERFLIKISHLGKTPLSQPILVRMSWFEPSLRLRQGNQVQLLVTLAPPHGLLNSKDFLLQKWLASQNIVALGKVKKSPSNQIIDASITWRQRLVEHVQQLDLAHSRWIMSLAFGARDGLNDEDWHLLQITGTAHLFAISGMHLAIVSGLLVLLFKAILFACLWFNTHLSGTQQTTFIQQHNVFRLSLLLSLPFCILYAVLSGLQVPVLRALFGLFCYLYFVYFTLHWRFSSVLLFLLCAFLIMFPLSILSLSFWFSFSAVLLIGFFMWRFSSKAESLKQKLSELVFLQVFLSLLMLPAAAASFDTISIISPLINLLLLPLFSFVLVPLSLLSIFASLLSFNEQANTVFSILDGVFSMLLVLLNYSASLPIAGLKGLSFTGLFWCMAILFLLLAALPFWPQRKFIAGSLLALMFFTRLEWLVSKPEWKVNLLDVGQGLSVMIESQGEVLIYDTGKVFPRDVIEDSLASEYFDFDVHALVNSHYDTDHAGGNQFLFRSYNIKNVYGPAYGCYRSAAKQQMPALQGLTIEVLWPLESLSGAENNDSCVLKVSRGPISLLLTGDIEADVERKLIALYGDSEKLRSTILISPHHGSKTSSSLAFVKQVQADYALVSSKFMNQWGFPHEPVLSNYAAFGTKVLNTAYEGRITIEIGENGYHIKSMRGEVFRPWYLNIRRY